MFHVVEFESSCGGGLGLVRDEWLTPRKQESFWPPFKLTAQYNKCLVNGDPACETWTLYAVKRIFYSTEDILKARVKLKEAESESELVSAAEESSGRKRKAKRILYSSDDDSNDEIRPLQSNRVARSQGYEKRLILPFPPSSSCAMNNGSSLAESLPPIIHHASTSLGDESDTRNEAVDESPKSSASGTSVSHQRYLLNSSFHSNISDTNSNHVVQSTGLAVIARHLAKIERRINEISETQKILVQNLAPNLTSVIQPLPAEIKVPCDTEEHVTRIEQWLLLSPENEIQMEKLLSVIGGKKVQHVVRRILEKIFTNNLAKEYNWTGKHNKKALKGLKLMNILQSAVRKNATTANASDSEIHTVVQNWFRFVKDRDGGREQRRRNTGAGHQSN